MAPHFKYKRYYYPCFAHWGTEAQMVRDLAKATLPVSGWPGSSAQLILSTDGATSQKSEIKLVSEVGSVFKSSLMFLYNYFKTFVDYLKLTLGEIIVWFQIPHHHFRKPTVAHKPPNSLTYPTGCYMVVSETWGYHFSDSTRFKIHLHLIYSKGTQVILCRL